MSTHTIEALCILSFLVIAYKPMKRFLISYLDSYSEEVSKKIIETEQLADSANKTLEFYKAQHKAFVEYAEEVNKHHKEAIEEISSLAIEAVEKKYQLKQQIHKEKLEIYKREELDSITLNAITKSMMIATIYLKENAPKSEDIELQESLELIKNKKVSFN